jgi:ABC-type amino acid transport substrate-binding protein
MGPAKDALVTAFATGSVFVVLPILSDRAKDLVRKCAPDNKDAPNAVDVLIPLAFTFPGPGTLMILGFLPFAAWMAGVTITVTQIPAFLLSGLASLFGSTMVAVPFLLNLLRIPADLFQLYVVSDVFTGRFGMFLSGVFTLVFSALGSLALAGVLRIRKRSLIRLGIVTLAMALVGVLGVRLYFTFAVSHEYTAGREFLDRALLMRLPNANKVDAQKAEATGDEKVSALDRIRSRGVIRLGYRADRLPFSFQNSTGQLVGHDIDLAHLLAGDLGVGLELVEVTKENTAELLKSGAVDVVMSGVAISPDGALRVDFTAPYIDETLAFIVPDHRRHEFATRESAQSLRGLKVAVPPLPHLDEQVAHYLDHPETVVIDSPEKFFTDPELNADALVYSAEAGSAWTLLHPEFSVVVPQPDVVRVPVAFPVAPGDDRMRTFLNTWIELKRRNKTLKRLYDYWILGEEDGAAEPRWSVIRDVLGWVR